MKKLLSVLALWLLLGGTIIASPVLVNLSLGIDENLPIIPGHGKNPVLVPQAWLDDHEITFTGMHPAFTLLLIEDDVVFSLDLPSTASSVILPFWLSGEYQIVLRPNGCNYYFYGYIEL